MGLKGAILVLIILGAGIWVARIVLEGSIAGQDIVESQGLQEFVRNANQLFDLAFYAVVGLVILLIIIALATGGRGKKELKEKREEESEKEPEEELEEEEEE